MFLSRNKKNNVYPCKPQFYYRYIKVGFKGGQNYIYVCSWCIFTDALSFSGAMHFLPNKYSNTVTSFCDDDLHITVTDIWEGSEMWCWKNNLCFREMQKRQWKFERKLSDYERWCSKQMKKKSVKDGLLRKEWVPIEFLACQYKSNHLCNFDPCLNPTFIQ